jgi:hypothetical protein
MCELDSNLALRKATSLHLNCSSHFTGQNDALRCAGVLSNGRQLLHTLLDDAESAAGSWRADHNQKRVSPEGTCRQLTSTAQTGLQQ